MKLQQILAGTFALQLALTAFTWWPTSSVTPPARDLLPDGTTVNRIVVSGSPDAESDSVELVRNGDTWTIASAFDYPAATAKVDELIETLSDIQLRRVVATSPTRHEALGVGADAFEKRVEMVLDDGSTRAAVLSAARSKASHLRLDGEDTVYEVRGLSAWSIRNAPRSYWARDLFDVEAATLSGFSLKNGGMAFSATRTLPAPTDSEGVVGAWTNDPTSALVLPEGMALSSDAVETLVEAAIGVTLSEPVAAAATAAHGFDTGVHVSWTTTVAGESQLMGFTIGAEVDGKRLIQLDNADVVLTTASPAIDELLDASLDGLVTAVEAVPPPADAVME
ncbi:MAG: DUF4340 domain-containing protein [Myxococcota bacterium]